MAMALSSMRRMPDCSILCIREAANLFIFFLFGTQMNADFQDKSKKKYKKKHFPSGIVF